MARKKSTAPKPSTVEADRAFFELKLYLLDLRPFVAGMSAGERQELGDRCRAVVLALEAIPKPASDAA